MIFHCSMRILWIYKQPAEHISFLTIYEDYHKHKDSFYTVLFMLCAEQHKTTRRQNKLTFINGYPRHFYTIPSVQPFFWFSILSFSMHFSGVGKQSVLLSGIAVERCQKYKMLQLNLRLWQVCVYDHYITPGSIFSNIRMLGPGW